MSTSPPSIPPQLTCPSALRAVFNYLGVPGQVARGIVTARQRPAGTSSEVMEYFDRTGVRFALAQRKRNSADAWDPKNFWFDGVAWRSYQSPDRPHYCTLCVLAATRV